MYNDILKPKSKEDITNDLSHLSQKVLSNKLFGASRKSYNHIVKMLLDAGANINAKDDSGWTSLMYASCNGHKDVVEFLLVSKADVNIKNQWGKTALKYALKYDHIDIIDLLKKYGATE